MECLVKIWGLRNKNAPSESISPSCGRGSKKVLIFADSWWHEFANQNLDKTFVKLR